MLAARGEDVRGVDSGHPDGAAGLCGDGVEVVLDTDGLAQLEGTRTVVKSPGVPREAPVIAAALERGHRRGRRARARLAGDSQPLRRGDRDQRQDDDGRAARPRLPHGGRAGRRRRQRRHAALLAGRRRSTPPRPSSARPRASSSRTATAFAPECAVFLNLAPDHLDRHADLDAYLAAKLRIFANQGNDDVAVYNADEPALAGADLGGCARRVAFCRGAAPECEVALAEGTIFDDGEPLLEVGELGLFGEHNVANAMAAAAAALAMGLDRDAVREGLRSFAGVPHRLEQVAEIGGVRFVNDSKATNVASAIVGIGAFEGGVHAILGGSEKGEPFAPLVEPVRERCAACYLIGETADRLARRAGAGRRGRGRAAPLRRPRGRRAPRRRRGPPRRGRPALARLRQLRRLRELRTARRALPRDRRGAGVSARASLPWPGSKGRPKKREEAPRRQACPPSTTCCSRRPSACSPSAR